MKPPGLGDDLQMYKGQECCMAGSSPKRVFFPNCLEMKVVTN